MLKYVKESDPELYELTMEETDRQEHNIEMIASESTVPPEVMEMAGSIWTNKTLEGYPGARFQAGSEVADKLETLANERACRLFKADHVNIQPYSGTTANYVVYASVLDPGDRVLAMRLDQGGHLSHGSSANWMSKQYDFQHYGVDPATGLIDYDALEKQAREFKPKLLLAGASSYPRLIDYEKIGRIARDVGAYSMVDMAHVAGLVAAGLIPSPIPHVDFVSSSTTKTLCSARAGMVFCKAEYAKKLDHGVFPGSLGSMHLTTMAAKCWSFKYAASDEFREIMQRVLTNSKYMCGELKAHGFDLVCGTSDNHLIVVDLRSKGVTGKQMQTSLDKAGITVSKQQIPDDPESPMVTSGIRIGLTSTAQRGLKEPEIKRIVELIDRVAADPENEANLAAVKKDAMDIVRDHPLYPAGVLED
jgi:Glycine/serine hydroxymethyltransferase